GGMDRHAQGTVVLTNRWARHEPHVSAESILKLDRVERRLHVRRRPTHLKKPRLPRRAGRIARQPVPIHATVRPDACFAINTDETARPVPVLASDVDATDVTRRGHVMAQPSDEEVGTAHSFTGDRIVHEITCAHIEQTDAAVGIGLARQAEPSDDRNRASERTESNAPAEERLDIAAVAV